MKSKILKDIPLMPLKGLFVFPKMVFTIEVQQQKSIHAAQFAYEHNVPLFLVAHKYFEGKAQETSELYSWGVIVHVNAIKALENDTYRITVEGDSRAELLMVKLDEDFDKANAFPCEDNPEATTKHKAQMRIVMKQFVRFSKTSKRVSPETIELLEQIEEPGRFADMIASHIPVPIDTKQQVLETLNIEHRLDWIIDCLNKEHEIVLMEKKINERVRKSMEETQKEFYLREQLKAIQQELGEKDGKNIEIEELEQKIKEAKMPKNTEDVAYRELERYEKIPSAAPESGIIRNYIGWLVSLPWSKTSEDIMDLKHARAVLNRDHDGLETVKERILEYLAVRQLTNSLRGPILCLSGPPGVGKTSLARSIAESLNREFVRASLGGVRDESEIRGHRRTYVGAMPGRIIQGIKKVGTKNPVFLLDEIDKMANDFRGDPASAMLEVLDPEQNATFSDHYIEEPFDLSEVLFIATANDLSTIPAPLRDRMEIIELSSYTEYEKFLIAKNHLIPKQMKEHGLNGSQLRFNNDAIKNLIRYYTREAGVRGLERTISSVCRRAAKQIVLGEKKRVTVTVNTLEKILGKKKYLHGLAEVEDQVGVATGLAYTQVGGDTLQIEVSISPGEGKLQLTGKLGDVMKESAQTALSYVRSKTTLFNIDPTFHEKNDIHIHVPEGATPKDGPSAGVTIVTALVSALTERKIHRDVGMTGEVTLRGRVLPIGGVKEKCLSAHRAGLKTIILPLENERDIDSIPKSVREDLTFHFVTDVLDVLRIALEE